MRRPATHPAQGFYFYMSYAQTAPTPEATYRGSDDFPVRRFYANLCESVSKRAAPRSGLAPGFVNNILSAASDWTAGTAQALGTSEVFVPLYSPRYLVTPWPNRERAAFQQRLGQTSTMDTREHVMPVLWVPPPRWEDQPELDEAIALGADVPEYQENGMRALCALSAYRTAYARMLDILATRIVEIAESRPMGPSAVPGLGTVSVRQRGDTESRFIIGVSAPTIANAPRSLMPNAYGTTSRQWRPFVAAALPVADYVATVAERLGLDPQIVDFHPDNSSRHDFDQSPGIVLVDPSLADDDREAARLRAMITELPPWVITIVVTDRDASQVVERRRDIGKWVAAVLDHVGGDRVVRMADEAEELISRTPAAIADARRLFLRHRSEARPLL